MVKKTRGPGWSKTSREDAERLCLQNNVKAMAMLKKYKSKHDEALTLAAEAVKAFNKECKIASFNIMNGHLLWCPANKVENKPEFNPFEF